MNTYRTSTWITMSVIVIILLLLAACGGAAAPTATAPPEPTEPPAEPTETQAEAAAEPTATEAEAEPTEAPEPTATTEEATVPDEPLLVLEWSGYEVTGYPQFYVPFAEKYEGNLEQVVEYSFFAADAEAYSKMQTGFDADVIHPCNNWWELYVENDLVQPIDTSRLSNWDGVHEGLAEVGQINGEQYFIPWDWGYESILVRTDLVEEVPTSWNDLWDEQYAGHVAIWDNGVTNFVVAALALGYDPANTTEEQNEEIKQKLLELKPNVLTYWTDFTQTYELPTTGDVWLLANAWQDAYASVQSEEYEVEYIQPEEGRLGWVCGFGIAADAQNVDLAYELIDAAIAPESMAALGNEYWYGFSNMDAMPMVDEFVVDFMELDQVDTLRERTVFYPPLTEEQRQTMTSIWDEVKAAPAQ